MTDDDAPLIASLDAERSPPRVDPQRLQEAPVYVIDESMSVDDADSLPYGDQTARAVRAAMEAASRRLQTARSVAQADALEKEST